MDKKEFEKIKELYDNGNNEIVPGHSFENHVLKVYENMKKIIPDEDVDREVLEYATLLHDVGRCYERNCGHAEKGAELAEEFLIDDLGRNKKFADRVSECIRHHSNRPHLEPPNREAEILWIADKMHAMGATGLCRFLMTLGAKNYSCDEAVRFLKQRVLDAEERARDFGFDDMVEGLDPLKDFVKRYEEENHAPD